METPFSQCPTHFGRTYRDNPIFGILLDQIRRPRASRPGNWDLTM